MILDEITKAVLSREEVSKYLEDSRHERGGATRARIQSYLEELAPKATGTYSNFLADEGEARIRDAYPDATYERLAEIKRAYDPGNLFQLNQNIAPAPPIAKRGYGSL